MELKNRMIKNKSSKARLWTPGICQIQTKDRMKKIKRSGASLSSTQNRRRSLLQIWFWMMISMK